VLVALRLLTKSSESLVISYAFIMRSRVSLFKIIKFDEFGTCFELSYV